MKSRVIRRNGPLVAPAWPAELVSILALVFGVFPAAGAPSLAAGVATPTAPSSFTYDDDGQCRYDQRRRMA